MRKLSLFVLAVLFSATACFGGGHRTEAPNSTATPAPGGAVQIKSGDKSANLDVKVACKDMPSMGASVIAGKWDAKDTSADGINLLLPYDATQPATIQGNLGGKHFQLDDKSTYKVASDSLSGSFEGKDKTTGAVYSGSYKCNG